MFRGAMPDLRVIIEDMIAEGDKAIDLCGDC
jgi:predicted ester cyclase